MSVFAQTTKFKGVCAKNEFSVIWTVSKDKNGDTQLKIDSGGTKITTQKFAADWSTLEWKISDSVNKVYGQASIKNGVITITGTVNGKKVSRKETLKHPWYQNIQYSAPHVIPMKEGSGVTYSLVNVRDLKIYDMQATFKKTYRCGNHFTRHLFITPDGIFAKFWKANYYIDTSTKMFVRYNSVEGRPGTPETVWTICE